MIVPVSVPVVFSVLKRGKVKKGRDLIGAEEGDDPFADISSVGEAFILCSQHMTFDLYMSLQRSDLYDESL